MKKKFRVFIHWADGGTEQYDYVTSQKANEVARGYKIAFGQQIDYIDVYEVRL